MAKRPNIDILPANISLAGADLVMDRLKTGKEQLLKNVLDPLRDDYDFIIIDCPPSLGLLNTNALTAADSVLISGTVRILRAGRCDAAAADDPPWFRRPATPI